MHARESVHAALKKLHGFLLASLLALSIPFDVDAEGEKRLQRLGAPPAQQLLLAKCSLGVSPDSPLLKTFHLNRFCARAGEKGKSRVDVAGERVDQKSAALGSPPKSFRNMRQGQTT